MSTPGESLPPLLVTICCGACGGTVNGDEDGHYCDGCQLRWGHDPFADEPPQFMDEDAPTCLEQPAETTHEWTRPVVVLHGETKVEQQYRSIISPCNLPRGHSTPHFFPVSTIRKVVGL